MQAMKGVDDIVKKCSASGGAGAGELLKATAELRKLLTPPTDRANLQPGIVDKMIVHAARAAWDKVCGVWLIEGIPLRMVFFCGSLCACALSARSIHITAAVHCEPFRMRLYLHSCESFNSCCVIRVNAIS